MAVEILQKSGTATVWADTTDYPASTPVSDLLRTHQILLENLAASGGARQGAKADLGAVRAHLYAVYVGIEFDVIPVSLATVDFYLAQSPSSTVGDANPGGTNGTDAAYTGTVADGIDNSLRQLTFLGSLSVTADDAPDVEYQRVGTIGNLMRYVSPVVHNNASQALEGDSVEMFVALIPLITETQ